jgi:hypothetical protein
VTIPLDIGGGMVLKAPSSNQHLIHGQSQEEATSANEQAQAPKALEGSPPQEAHVAKVTRGADPSSDFRGGSTLLGLCRH